MNLENSTQNPRQLADRALEFLDETSVAPNPRNYTLAYVYFAGTHPEVREEIDRMLSHGAFNHDAAMQLYETIFGLDSEAAAIKSASETIERTLAKVLDALGDAGKDAAEYGRVLEDFEGRVAPDNGESIDLRGAIETILSETRKMEDRSRDLEQRFSETSGEIVELRRNLEEMRVAATTDGLTGVANRKHFDMHILQCIEEANAAEHPMSLIIADIDFFKTFNDDHGHQVGDMVLRLVAKSMSDTVRGRDFVARYGGEEFAVILPETALQGAMAVAENIRKTISSKRIARKTTGEKLGMVTLSFGVAQYHRDEPVASLIERADAALYRAKNRGRNRVETMEQVVGEIRRMG